MKGIFWERANGESPSTPFATRPRPSQPASVTPAWPPPRWKLARALARTKLATPGSSMRGRPPPPPSLQRFSPLDSRKRKIDPPKSLPRRRDETRREPEWNRWKSGFPPFSPIFVHFDRSRPRRWPSVPPDHTQRETHTRHDCGRADPLMSTLFRLRRRTKPSFGVNALSQLLASGVTLSQREREYTPKAPFAFTWLVPFSFRLIIQSATMRRANKHTSVELSTPVATRSLSRSPLSRVAEEKCGDARRARRDEREESVGVDVWA